MNRGYLRSLCTRILTLTLLPLRLSMSFSLPTAQPSALSFRLVSTTMSLTSSRFSIRAAPSVSEQAHDCGQPQLMSTPPAYGATRDDARDTSAGELAPNWTIVGGWGPAVDIVKSVTHLLARSAVVRESSGASVGRDAPLCRATELRLNSFARIMGVQHRSVP